MVANVAPRAVRMLWTPSLPCADLKIIRPNTARGSKSISRNCAIEWMVLKHFRSKRAWGHSLLMGAMASAGVRAILSLPSSKRAAALFTDGLTVREVAAILRVSKSEAGRLRMKAMDDGLLTPEDHQATVQ